MLINGAEKWRAYLWVYAPLFLWIGVIFYLSSGQGSFEQTSRFIGPLLKAIFPSASAETLAQYHGFIRKMAHLAAYAVLALLAARAFFASTVEWPKAHWALTAMIVVILVAGIDEGNQSFNAKRSGSAIDILIDAMGGLSALGVLYLLRRRAAAGA